MKKGAWKSDRERGREERDEHSDNEANAWIFILILALSDLYRGPASFLLFASCSAALVGPLLDLQE